MSRDFKKMIAGIMAADMAEKGIDPKSLLDAAGLSTPAQTVKLNPHAYLKDLDSDEKNAIEAFAQEQKIYDLLEKWAAYSIRDCFKPETPLGSWDEELIRALRRLLENKLEEEITNQETNAADLYEEHG